MSYLSKSPWIIHYDGSSCNGCDIEVLASLTPMYDIERLGIINTGNPKHADILLITGSVNDQSKEVLQNLYNQMPDPKVVVALGICATSGGIFQECYNIYRGVDKHIPVDVYVPGCAVRPEAIIDGVVAGLKALEEKYKKIQDFSRNSEKIPVEIATIEDAESILELQKIAFNSEAELNNDPNIEPMIQTLDDLKNDFKSHIFMKSTIGNKIIGSIRAQKKGDTAYIYRLAVDPNYQELGIGKRLMMSIEKYFSDCARYELFTSLNSRRNIFFYKKLNYIQIRTEVVNDKLTKVYFQKSREVTH
jgi:ech hydrogenase subunit C